MDFIFEDDNDEVGSDIEAYCPKCKADTTHTVIDKYEDEIRRVQCSPCSDVHAYRKPRGEVEDDVPEPIAARKRAQVKKPTWQEAMDRTGAKALANARPYSIRDTYHEGDIVQHPKFGTGFVTEIQENKAEITFQDERRVLVHNRPELAAQMPAIAQVPLPREERRPAKGGKKAATPARATAPKEPAKKVEAAVAKEPAKKVEAVVAKEPVKKVEAAAKPAKAEVKPKKADKAKASASKKPAAAASKKPVAASSAVQGKAARAKSAATKKGAAKGKPAATAARTSKAKAAPKARVRPAATRTARPVAKGKVKASKKAR